MLSAKSKSSSLLIQMFVCGMPAGNAYPSGHLVPSPILGLASAPIVETKFLELAMSLLDFSHRIPLGTFSILLLIYLLYRFINFDGTPYT